MTIDLSEREIEEIRTNQLHFWASFRSAVKGVTLPREGYAKGSEFVLHNGITYIQGTDANTAGKVVSAYKRTKAEDARYLREAGFTFNSELDIPCVPTLMLP